MSLGMTRDSCLDIVGLTKNQFYYEQTGGRRGKRPSSTTRWRDPATLLSHWIPNEKVVLKVVEIKLNPDLPNWYRLITRTLQILGYYINHKKLFRLMKEHLLLEDARRRKGREFVQFRRVCPAGPLCILEMDIKYVWVYGQRKFAFVLTVLDTFTRYVLNWAVGFTMKGSQVKDVWEYVVAEYLQPHRISLSEIEVEARSDNGRQLGAKVLKQFFEANHIRHVFTHPYTPEENGHVESFHSILSDALDKDRFASLSDLEKRLDRFYTSYNDDRSHSGTRGIPPAKFWVMYEMELVKVTYLDDRSAKIAIKVPYQDILTLPGIHKYDYRVMRAGGRPSPYFEALDGPKNNNVSVGLHNTFESTSV